jgi:hypothetical protein
MSPEAVPVLEHAGRKYRSKKQRPCDLCRSRKIQCKLQGNEAACELCRRLDRRCTFILGPVRRKYRPRADQDQSTNGGSELVRAVAGDRRQQQQQDRGQEEDATMSGTTGNGEAPNQVLDPASFDWLPLNQDVPDQIFTPRTASNLLSMNWPEVGFPMDALPDELPLHNTNDIEHHSHSADGEIIVRRESQGTLTSLSTSPINSVDSDRHAGARQHCISDSISDWPSDFSVDAAQKGHSNMLVGLSSEFDPFFLRHYLYNVHDTYRMFRLHIRKVVDDEAMLRLDHSDSGIGSPPPRPLGPAPVQFVVVDEEIWKDEVKSAEALFATPSTERSDAELLNKLVPTDLGARLIKL